MNRSRLANEKRPRRRPAPGAVELPLIVLILIAMVGCGDRPTTRAAISGQVLINGQPLDYGSIRFIPQGPGRPSFATLDKNGRFDFGEEGAEIGPNRVEVIAAEQLNDTDYKWHAPQKYVNIETSGLECVVTGPADDIVINLEWGNEKPAVVRGTAADADPKNLKGRR